MPETQEPTGEAPPPADTKLEGGVSRGLAWVGLASSMVGLLDIIAYALIVAFWLTRAEFGTAALAFTLFPVLDLATDLGLSSAIIQRDDHTREKISTVFWLNVGMSLLLAGLLAFVVGPGLAALQGQPVLTGLFAAYGIKLVWQNVYFTPAALMKRELRFKELSVIRMLANIAEFAGKVGFAAAGFGVWCFVAGPLCRVLVTGVGIQICHPWRPQFVLRLREATDWFKFGFKTSAHKMLFHLYSNIDYQVVAFYFGEAANGLYTLAFKLVLEPAYVLSAVIVNVAFPTFAKLKHHKDRLFEQLVSFMRMNLVVMLAFLGVAFVCAEEILALFSTEAGSDYVPAAPAVRILCMVGLLRALSFVIPAFLDGVGRPNLTLRYAAIATVILPSTFVASAVLFGDALGYLSVAWAWTFGYPLAFAVLVSMALALLDVGGWVFFRRLAGIIGCAAVALPAAMLTKWLAAPAPTVVRFALAAAVMLGLFSVLLARFQGISPATVKRALRG